MNHPSPAEWIRAAAPKPGPDAISLTATAGAVEIEARDSEQPAKPRKFTMVAYTGGPMQVGAYYNPVVVDFAGLELGNSARPILIDHESDLDHVLGQTEKLEVKGGKLVVTGNIFGESDTAKQVIALNDRGFKFQASIGARVTNREFVPEGSTTSVNGRTVNGPVNIARKSVLGEVSFVVLGADDNTSASIAASSAAERKSAMDFQQWLAAMGLSIDGITAEQKTKLEAKFAAEQKSAPADTVKASGGADTLAGGGKDDEDPAIKAQADIRAKRAEEIKRLGAIEILAAKYKEDFEPTKLLELQEQAITAGHSGDKFELELLRARKPKAPQAPGIIVGGDKTLTNAVVEAAFCTAAGLSDVEKQFKPETLEAAHKRFRRSASLQEVLVEAAIANGYGGRNFRSDPRAVLRYAFGDVQAGFSTIDVAGILSNTANKFLLEGFQHVEMAWQQISTTRPVGDFKQITSYRLTGSGQYEKVAPSGEIKHGTLGEESFTNQADTYGLILAITRKDLINDDLGAFTAVPRKLGRGAGLKLNDVFWTAFLDNSAFFTSGRNNYFEGAATNLQASSLKTAVQMFRRQTDTDGKPLGVAPKILLVGPENEVAADELYTSTNNNTGGSATTEKVPNRNVHAGKYRPVVSAYLSNASYTGYSTTAWYLKADPADLSAIEVAFLNGQQSPTIETADADFNTLGIQMRGYHDFGVTKQDYRAGVKSKGAA